MQKPYSLALNLYESGIKNTGINYTALDKDVYPLYITLLVQDQETRLIRPLEIPKNAQIEMNFINPKGGKLARVGEVVDYENGLILYKLDSSDIEITGNMIGAVSVVSVENGMKKRLTWREFKFEVNRSLSGGASPSPGQQPWFGQIMEELSEFKNRLDAIENMGGGGEGTPYHDKLLHLDFASSKHTGFASAADVTEINNKLNSLGSGSVTSKPFTGWVNLPDEPVGVRYFTVGGERIKTQDGNYFVLGGDTNG